MERSGRRPVKVRAVTISCLQEEGFALCSKVVPDDTATYVHDEFGDILQGQLNKRRALTCVVYVDDNNRYGPGCVLHVFACYRHLSCRFKRKFDAIITANLHNFTERQQLWLMSARLGWCGQ